MLSNILYPYRPQHNVCLVFLFQLLEVEVSNFRDIKEEIIIRHQNFKDAINPFYEFLQQTEKSRIHSYKHILKDAYNKLIEVSYMLPYDLQKFFEHELLVYIFNGLLPRDLDVNNVNYYLLQNINQVTLNNLRWYTDLCENLSLQTENNIKCWLQALWEITQIWKDALKRSAAQRLEYVGQICIDNSCVDVNTVSTVISSFTNIFDYEQHQS